MSDDPTVPVLTSLLLLESERHVIYRALTLASAMFDALDDVASATLALELAYRVVPGGLRDA